MVDTGTPRTRAVQALAGSLPDRLFDDQIGKRLKDLRLQRGLNQRDLATKGLSKAYLSRIEVGERQPTMKVIYRLAMLLDSSPGYLCWGVGAAQRTSDETEWLFLFMRGMAAEEQAALWQKVARMRQAYGPRGRG